MAEVLKVSGFGVKSPGEFMGMKASSDRRPEVTRRVRENENHLSRVFGVVYLRNPPDAAVCDKKRAPWP